MKTSKVILGLKCPSEFSMAERQLIIEEYLQSDKNKNRFGRNIQVNRRKKAIY